MITIGDTVRINHATPSPDGSININHALGDNGGVANSKMYGIVKIIHPPIDTNCESMVTVRYDNGIEVSLRMSSFTKDRVYILN